MSFILASFLIGAKFSGRFPNSNMDEKGSSLFIFPGLASNLIQVAETAAFEYNFLLTLSPTGRFKG